MHQEADLLYAVLALQMKFITRDQVRECCNLWSCDPGRSLRSVIESKGYVKPASEKALESMVEAQIAQFGDAEKALAALRADEDVRRMIEDLAPRKEEYGTLLSWKGGESRPGQALEAGMKEAFASGRQTVESSAESAGTGHGAGATANPGDSDGSKATLPAGQASDPGIMRGSAGHPPGHAEKGEGASAHRYVEDGVLGRGGMGVVLKTFDLDLRRPVAMKVVLEARNRARVERFIEEAQVTGGLEHPNIVPVHELGTTRDGKAYFTMKMVRGESLQSVIERLAKGDAATLARYPLTQILNVFLKVCDAVAFAHSRGIVHRDLKPENVMTGDFGEVLVMDWGLAKIVRETGSPALSLRPDSPNPPQPPPFDSKAKMEADSPDYAQAAPVGSDAASWQADNPDTGRPIPPATEVEMAVASTARPRTAASRTLEGQVMGTPSFMPPEQAAGRLAEIDEVSDVWSLGAILYALLCHEAPHTGDTMPGVISKAMAGIVVPPRRRSPRLAIPRELEAVCMKAMAPDKKARYQSAEAVAEDVQAFLDRRLVSSYSYSPIEKLTRWIQRHPAASMSAGVAGFLLAACAALAGVLVQQARLADARASIANLRAREAEMLTAQAQADAASARSLLEKGRKVSAVLQGAEIELAPVFRTLEQSFYSAKSLEEKRKIGDAVLGRVDAFAARVGDDPASRAAWLALRGWLMHLACREEESAALLEKAATADPDVAYGRLFQALLAAARFLEASRMPSVVFVGGVYQVRESAEETETIRRERERFDQLLGKVRQAGVWGGSSAKDFGLVLDGLEGIRGRDLAAAEEALTRTLAIPEMSWLRADLLIARAKVRHLKKDCKAMEEDLDLLLDRFPDHVQARYYRGLLRMEEGRAIMAMRKDSLPKYGEALALFDRAAREDPANLAAHANRASVRLQFGRIHAHRAMPFHEDFEAAIADFDLLVRKSPGDANALNLRGFAHKEYALNLLNRKEECGTSFRKAFDDFSAAIEMEPRSVAALANRAEIALHLGNAEAEAERSPLDWYAKGQADCESALALSPNFFTALDMKGQMLLAEARWRSIRGEDPVDSYAKALELYSNAVERNPESVELLIRRGLARGAEAEHLSRRGKDSLASFEASIADLTRAADLDPRYSRAHEQLAICHAMMSRELRRQGKDREEALRKAVDQFGVAANLSPGYPVIRLNLVLCSLELADLVEGKGGEFRGILDAIIVDCDYIVSKAPGMGMAYAVRAQANRKRGELEADAGRDATELYRKADADCAEAARLGSAGWDVLLCQGRCRMVLHDFPGAVEALEKALDKGGSDRPEVRNLLDKARELAKKEGEKK